MSIKSIIQNKWVEGSIMVFTLGLTFVCMYTPDIIFFKKIAYYTVHIMLLFLFAGLFFLIMDHKRLLLWNFALVGILSVFLKSSSHTNLQLAKDIGFPEVKVAFINLSNIIESPDSIISLLQNKHIDIIAFNEFTPNWASFLDEKLKDTYLYRSEMLRIDNFGKAIYSRLPISQTDTLTNGGASHLLCNINLGSNNKLYILNTYFLPPLTRNQIADLNIQMDFLIDEIRRIKNPLICLGDFNLAPWSNELRAFKYTAQLNDSRRDIIQRSNQDIGSILNVPVEHIIFNEQLSCTFFNNLHDHENNYIGLIGIYQLTSIANNNRDNNFLLK